MKNALQEVLSAQAEMNQMPPESYPSFSPAGGIRSLYRARKVLAMNNRMSEGLRANWPLVAGVSLPIVFLLGFLVFTLIARATLEPPKHDLVYFSYGAGDFDVHIDFSVIDGRVRARAVKIPEPRYHGPKLYRVDVGEMVPRPIDVPVPKDFEGAIDIPIPDLERVVVSGEMTAPDGYVFDYGYPYSGNLGIIDGLFFRGEPQGPSIGRFGAVYPILEADGPDSEGFSDPTSAYPVALSMQSMQFLGWVISDG